MEIDFSDSSSMIMNMKFDVLQQFFLTQYHTFHRSFITLL